MRFENVIPNTILRICDAAAADIDIREHIVCGIDFSDAGQRALDVAAALAKCQGTPLLIVHAVNEPARGSLPSGVRESLALFERKRLFDERERVKKHGVEVVERVYAGEPEEVLAKAISAPTVRLLVLSSGEAKSKNRSLGSVADRVVTRARIPTMVIRCAEPILAWLQGKRTLKIFIAADLTPESEAAIRWGIELRALGKCDVTIAHIEDEYSPVPQPDSVGSATIESIHAQLRTTRTRLFGNHVARIVHGEKVRRRVVTGWGPSDAHLIHLAKEAGADLIITGMHQSHGLGRILHHSVSRGLLNYAPMNVACVPARPHPPG